MGGPGATARYSTLESGLAAQAMRDLPVGVPKLIVSTVASGDTRPYVGAVDIAMTPSPGAIRASSRSIYTKPTHARSSCRDSTWAASATASASALAMPLWSTC